MPQLLFCFSFSYLRTKREAKKKNITVIPFNKWITEKHRRKRLKGSTPRKRRGIEAPYPIIKNEQSPTYHRCNIDGLRPPTT